MSERQDKWDDLFGRIAETVERWRQEHLEATLTEIEEAVGNRIAEVRTQMVEDLGPSRADGGPLWLQLRGDDAVKAYIAEEVVTAFDSAPVAGGRKLLTMSSSRR